MQSANAANPHLHQPHAAAMGAPAGMEHCPIMPTYGPPSIMFVEGSGCWLTDREGKRYLDLLSGLGGHLAGTLAPGGGRAASQAQRLRNTSNLYATEHASRWPKRWTGCWAAAGRCSLPTVGLRPTSAP